MKGGRFRRWFRLTDHSPDRARDVDEEISFHHAMRERELVEAGMSAEEARRAARATFGDEAAIRAEVNRIDSEMERRRRLRDGLGSMAQDGRQGMRSLRRSPSFTLVAVSTLVLGIGGNAVVFSLIEAVLLRSPAVESPDRLASIWTTCRRGDPRCSSSFPDYEDYRDRSTRFADIAAYTGRTVSVDPGGGAEVVGAELVTANYFALLGLEPAAGRLLQPLDGEARSDPALAVLSHRWWRTRFGGDPDAIGSTVRVNGIPYTIVGVAPPDFEGLVLGQAPELWAPLRGLPQLTEDGAARLESRGSRWIQGLVGRLAPGATLEGARAEMLRISDQLAAEDPGARGPRSVTVDALAGRVGGGDPAMVSFLGLLQGVLALTLLLACSNLANLMLARATARRSELGVRLALGVGRGRLIRQQMIESLVLAGAGGIGATILVTLAPRLVGGITLPRGIEIASTGATLNPAVLAYVAGVTVAAALLFGALPAIVAGQASVATVLREQRTGGTGTAPRLRSTLIGVQVAFGVVLLVGAGLFIGTLRARLNVDLGFAADGLSLVTIDPTLGGFGPDPSSVPMDRVIERIAAIPGVESVALGGSVPVRPGGNGTFVEVQGYQPAPDEEMRIEYSVVSRDYLRTLRLPVVAGRDFTASDGGAGEAVAIIDETMARRWWPGRDATGGTIRIGNTSLRVIGVARRTAWGGLEAGTTPFVFIAAGPGTVADRPLTVVVRSGGETSLLPAIRTAIRQTEPRLAIRSEGTMNTEIEALLAPQRTAAWLLSAFGLLALALAAIGIWGVISYSVSQRRRDLGIRIALGATNRRVVRLIARAMLLPVSIGIVAGLLAARSLSHTVEAFLFGVTATNPAVYILAALLLTTVAAAATWLPARRAASANPVDAMRAD